MSTPEELVSFAQLPREGTTVFSIGPALVRFTAIFVDGEFQYWLTQTQMPNYYGALVPHAGLRPDRIHQNTHFEYSFTFKRGDDQSRELPIFMASSMFGVTIRELREFVFGVFDEPEEVTPCYMATADSVR